MTVFHQYYGESAPEAIRKDCILVAHGVVFTPAEGLRTEIVCQDKDGYWIKLAPETSDGSTNG
jgi:hypothetical protein